MGEFPVGAGLDPVYHRRDSNMKAFLRIFLVLFVWFWSVRTALYLVDVFFFRGPDPAASAFLIIVLYVLFGITYGVCASGLIAYLLPAAAIPRKIGVARITGVALALYGFIDDLVIVYFVLLRSMIASLFWILILPLVLMCALILLLRNRTLSESVGVQGSPNKGSGASDGSEQG